MTNFFWNIADLSFIVICVPVSWGGTSCGSLTGTSTTDPNESGRWTCVVRKNPCSASNFWTLFTCISLFAKNLKKIQEISRNQNTRFTTKVAWFLRFQSKHVTDRAAILEKSKKKLFFALLTKPMSPSKTSRKQNIFTACMCFSFLSVKKTKPKHIDGSHISIKMPPNPDPVCQVSVDFSSTGVSFQDPPPLCLDQTNWVLLMHKQNASIAHSIHSNFCSFRKSNMHGNETNVSVISDNCPVQFEMKRKIYR